jgi:hypothetical protein
MIVPRGTFYSFKAEGLDLTIWNNPYGTDFILTSGNERWGQHGTPDQAAEHAALVLKQEGAPEALVSSVNDLTNWEPGTQI